MNDQSASEANPPGSRRSPKPSGPSKAAKPAGRQTSTNGTKRVAKANAASPTRAAKKPPSAGRTKGAGRGPGSRADDQLGELEFDNWYETPVFEPDDDERMEEMATAGRGAVKLMARVVLAADARRDRRRRNRGGSGRDREATTARPEPARPADPGPAAAAAEPRPADPLPQIVPERRRLGRTAKPGVAAGTAGEAPPTRTGRAVDVAPVPVVEDEPDDLTTHGLLKARSAHRERAARQSRAAGRKPQDDRAWDSWAEGHGEAVSTEQLQADLEKQPRMRTAGWRQRAGGFLDRWAEREVAVATRLDQALAPAIPWPLYGRKIDGAANGAAANGTATATAAGRSRGDD